MDYNTWTKRQLRDECKRRGLPVSIVRPTKAGKPHSDWLKRFELIKSLQDWDAANGVTPPMTPPPPAVSAAPAPAAPVVAPPAAANPPAVSAPPPAPVSTPPPPPPAPAKKASAKHIATYGKWYNFFSEFPGVGGASGRMVNQVAQLPDVEAARQYVMSYFELCGSEYAKDIAEKVKSDEFADLCKDTIGESAGTVNSRLEIYYGPRGTGKSTTAKMRYPNAEKVACLASDTPDSLFRGFQFEREYDAAGKCIGSHPVFVGSPIRTAMEKGLPVIMDEINLLPWECRQALQSVTDGGDEVTISGEKIKIAPGFKVIATMNLIINGDTVPLPEPIIDRAGKIEKFETDFNLMALIAFGC